MDTQQRHIIKKQVLELQLSSRKRAFQIQNEVSRIYRKRVVPLIDECCSELSALNVIHRIDRLELDIGNIPLNNLEEAFTEKVETLLWQRLAEKISASEAASTPSSTQPKTSQADSQLELFEYFIHTGTLPWWAEKLSKEDLEKCLDQLITTVPDAVKSLVVKSVNNKRYLKRLILQFSDEVLVKTVKMFSSGMSQFVADYIRDIEEIFKKTAVFEGIPQEKFRLEHWQGILVTLALTGRTTPDKLWFVRDALISLAANLGMNYVTLITRLYQAVQRLKKSGTHFKSDLPERLSEVYQESQSLQPAAEDSEPSNMTEITSPPIASEGAFPEVPQFLIDYLRDIEVIFTLAGGIGEGIQREHWQRMVRALPLSGSAAADKLRLAKDIVLALAASSGIPYVTLITRLHQAVQRLKKAGTHFKSEFPELLSEAYQEIQPLQPAAEESEPSNMTEITSPPIASEVAFPEVPQFLIDYLRDIEEVFTQAGDIREGIQREHWQRMVRALPLSGSAASDRLHLARELVVSLVASSGMSYVSLVSRLHQAAQRLKKAGIRFKSDFPERLSEVYQEIQSLQPTAEESEPSNMTEITSPSRSVWIGKSKPSSLDLPIQQEQAYREIISSQISNEVAFPEVPQFLIDYLRDIEEIFTQAGDIGEGIQREHWQRMVKALPLSGSAAADKLHLARDIVLALAASSGMSYVSLVSRLHQAVQRLEKAGVRFRSDFPERLSEVYQEIQSPQREYAYSGIISSPISSEVPFPGLPQSIPDYLRDIEEIFTQAGDIGEGIQLEHWQRILRTLPVFSSVVSDKLHLAKDIVLALSASSGIPYTNLISRLHQAVQRLKKRGTRFISDFPDMLSELYQDLQPVQPTHILERLKGSEDLFSDSEEIYISNSGLILLWPFLKRFFETLGLVRENDFMNTTAAERAALILQYVTDGSTEIPEHLLPLNKILCGIDLLEPVELNFEITENECMECENLLSAIIQHWSVLKNTSVSGFQRAFLQREGVLSIRDEGWLLRVERQTHDILLDKIPWSFSIVKLPWMKAILVVEW